MNYTNPARTNTFQFEINGQKRLSLQIEGIPLTGVAIGDALMENTPYNIQAPDNRVDLDALSIDFEVSEDLAEWFDINEWIYQCTITNDAHISLATSAVMAILDNRSQPILTVEYFGVQPMALSQLFYKTTDSDIVEIKANFTFRYDTIKITQIKTGKKIQYGDIPR